jgi:predicted DNA-binding protein (UPF0251 family)
MIAPLTPEERREFWRKVPMVHDDDSCWIWPGKPHHTGYGQTKFRGKWIGTHKLACFASGGVLLPGQIVTHNCDVRNCCRPRHLKPGSHASNAEERTERGNTYKPAKLAPEQVEEIRTLYHKERLTQSAIARRFQVGQKTVSDIVTYQSWRRPGDAPSKRWQRKRNRRAA